MTTGTTKTPMQRSGNLLFPKDKAQRPRKPIPGLDGFEITQNGLIYTPDGEFLEADPWPTVYLVIEDEAILVNITRATAAAWLSEDDKARVLSEIPQAAKHSEPRVAEMEAELQISRHAIAALTFAREGLGNGCEALPAPEGDRHRVEGMPIQDYKSFLYEPSRPPSKGGNTTALHAHIVMIDGEKYSFHALGTRQWIFKEDLATFDYVITPEGYRNIIKHTLFSVDAKGKVQRRGNRGYKRKLRTANTRLPGSRREQRD